MRQEKVDEAKRHNGKVRVRVALTLTEAKRHNGNILIRTSACQYSKKVLRVTTSVAFWLRLALARGLESSKSRLMRWLE